MASIKLQGDTSGELTISAPAVAGTNTITLPASTGTVITTGDSGTITQGMIGSGVTSTGPAFSAYMVNGNTGVSVTSASFTKIVLDTEEYDTNSNFDTSNYRFTPTVAGYYQINAGVTMAAPDTGCAAYLYKNGAGYQWGSSRGTANMFPTATTTTLVYMNGSTDYLELYIYNGHGTTLTTSYGRGYLFMNGYLTRAA
jgi:hypothetical protein